jgi:hypothetical protein
MDYQFMSNHPTVNFISDDYLFSILSILFILSDFRALTASFRLDFRGEGLVGGNKMLALPQPRPYAGVRPQN